MSILFEASNTNPKMAPRAGGCYLIGVVFLSSKAGEVGVGCGGTVVLGRAQVEEGGLRGAAMGSQKIKETLQTLKELLDDGLITEQEYEGEKREALKQWRKKQTEGEGGDRGQAPDAVVGTSSGRGREVSGQGSDTQLVATAATSSAPRGSEGVAADRSGAGPKASEGRHDDDDVGRRRVEVWRLPKTINPGGGEGDVPRGRHGN